MRTLTGYKIVRLHEGKLISACVPLPEAINYSESAWTYADRGPLFVFRSELQARTHSSMVGASGVLVVCVKYYPLVTRQKQVLVPGTFTKEVSQDFWKSTKNNKWPRLIPTVADTDMAAAISLMHRPPWLIRTRIQTIIDLYGDEEYYDRQDNAQRVQGT